MTENSISEKRVIDWLLEEKDPSVRYHALLEVVGKSDGDREVVAARKAISLSDLVQRILQKQKPGGYWQEPANPYHPKYKSSYWQIMTLGQLGMDKSSGRVRGACEYIFRFQLVEGGFSSCTRDLALEEYKSLAQKGERLPSREDYVASAVHEHEYSCLTGNMVAALNRIGYGEDRRVTKALQWLVEIQNEDGGWLCPYWRAHIRDKHGCFFGTICPLEAFSTVDRARLTPAMKQTVDKGAEFMLVHRLFKADHHGYRAINKNWLTLSFPMFTGYSVLRGLDVLTKLGYVDDERLDDAIELLLRKRQGDGRWVLESSPTGRMQVNIEVKGKSSKWVTLVALRTLRRLGRGS